MQLAGKYFFIVFLTSLFCYWELINSMSVTNVDYYDKGEALQITADFY